MSGWRLREIGKLLGGTQAKHQETQPVREWQPQSHTCTGGYLIHGIRPNDILDVYTTDDHVTRFTVRGFVGYADERGSIPMVAATAERFRLMGQDWVQVSLSEITEIQSAPVHMYAGAFTVSTNDKISYGDTQGRFSPQVISPHNIVDIQNTRLV